MSKFVAKLLAALTLPVLLMVALPTSVFAAPVAKFFQAGANACPIEREGVFNVVGFKQANAEYNCIWFAEGSITVGPSALTPDGSTPYCPGQPLIDTRAYGKLCITGYPAGTPLYGPTLETALTPATNGGGGGGVVTPSNPIPSRVKDPCDENSDKCCTSLDKTTNTGKAACPITKWTLTFINVLSGLAGIVVVTMIILGGIQYATSADDPGKVSAAKQRIFNALFGLLAFIFMYAFLQWIVPGGAF